MQDVGDEGLHLIGGKGDALEGQRADRQERLARVVQVCTRAFATYFQAGF
jgi:hypothetical protein